MKYEYILYHTGSYCWITLFFDWKFKKWFSNWCRWPTFVLTYEICISKSKFLGKITWNRFFRNLLSRLHRCRWRLMDTKCVGDKFEMLVMALNAFIAPISKLLHWHPKIVTNIHLSPISMSPIFSIESFHMKHGMIMTILIMTHDSCAFLSHFTCKAPFYSLTWWMILEAVHYSHYIYLF